MEYKNTEKIEKHMKSLLGSIQKSGQGAGNLGGSIRKLMPMFKEMNDMSEKT